MWTLLTSIVLILAAGDGRAAAATELREKLGELAAEVLKATKNQPVSVGVFSPTGLPDANSGPGIEGVLRDELERLKKGVVQADAQFEVKGDYAFARSRDVAQGGLKVVKVTARIIDKEFSEELLTIPLKVELDHTQSLAAILQPTARLEPDAQKPGGTKAERNAEIDKRLTEPRVHIHGENQTLISSTPESPYAVELLVRPLDPLAGPDEPPAKPRRAVEPDGREGRAFVEIKQDELYEVKLYNNSSAEVAVRLSVDGLDVFHFSKDRGVDGTPRFTHFIVPPKSDMVVIGWHNSLAGTENYLSFLVTGYGEGAVSKAGAARGQVGVIHVQFAKCSPLPESASARGGNETGFGPPREVRQKTARYEIEPPHDFVSVRYTR
jgi:hypothetical protein